MKYSTITCVLITAMLLFGGLCRAQIAFVNGYMINDKGDTLKGEIKVNPKKPFEGYNKVLFRDSTGVPKNFKPNKVKGYGYENNHFVSITDNGETLFYQRLTNGAIVLYKTIFESVSMNQSIKEFAYYLYKDGDKKLTEVKDSKFKKQIQDWMVSSPSFADEYKEGKTFNADNAIEAINNYNQWKKNN